MITILFFASLRETLGVSREQFDCNLSAIADVASLIEALRARNAAFADALAPTRNWRVAVNQEMANVNTPIASGDEVAFFPPVTGG
jgi:sulfur-carrier protein